MSGLALILGVEMLLGGGAVAKPETVAPTTVKMTLSRVTDNEAIYVWEFDGPGWSSTSAKGLRTTLNYPTGEGVKGEVEVTLRAVHYKNGGMDVTMNRRFWQGNTSRTESAATYEFVGLPSMPLSKLLKVRVKDPKTVPGTGVLALAEVDAPASQFSNFEWRKLGDRNQKVVYSKRVRLKNGQPTPNAMREPDAARMMKREGFFMSGAMSQAMKETFELEFLNSAPPSGSASG